MNNCPSESQWEAFADGDLSPNRRLALAMHLTDCPRCRTLIDDLLTLQAELAVLPDPQVPADFANRVMAAVRVEPAPAQAFNWQRALIAGLIAIGGLLELAFVFVVVNGYTLGDMAASVAIRFPGLARAIGHLADWLAMTTTVLSSPSGWVITFRVLAENGALLSAVTALAIGLILIYRHYHSYRGVEQK